MEKRKRVSYSVRFKLKVIKKAEEIGNREAGRLFDIDESNIRLWRKNKEKFEKSRNREQRTFRHGNAFWPSLEDELHRWIISEREKGAAISTVRIRLKAKAMAQEMKIENFMGGSTWCYRFMRRKKLAVRNRTTVGQMLPADWKEKSEEFYKYTKKLIAEKNFADSDIFNMDEVPLRFDCPPNRTVDAVGKNNIPISTTGHEKTAFTVVLSCSAVGEKLPPMVIFKRKTIPKENFPKGLEIQCNPKGWMNEETMISWLNSVWRKRKGSIFKPRALLVMDSMKAHIQENVKEACKKSGACLSIIPGGLTKNLQPLDSGINRSFKSKVRAYWEKWMTDGIHSYTKGGNLRRASYTEVCQWISDAWKEVTIKTIKNSFKKCKLKTSDSSDESSDDSENENPPDVNTGSFHLDEEQFRLFNSDSDESAFEGF